MKWTEWKSLWRFDKQVNIPHLSIIAMSPYGFVRMLWYSTSKEFKAWPNVWETGVVIGWRWPWTQKFKEKAWLYKDEMPLALYSAMDQVYAIRATKHFAMDPDASVFKPDIFFATKAAFTIKETIESMPCLHDRLGQPRYWIASCETCARKALLKAILVRGQYDGRGDLYAHESKRLVESIAERQAAHQKALKAHHQQLEEGI